jgi:hypothetical protein
MPARTREADEDRSEGIYAVASSQMTKAFMRSVRGESVRSIIPIYLALTLSCTQQVIGR